jgi:hypothetical protein
MFFFVSHISDLCGRSGGGDRPRAAEVAGEGGRGGGRRRAQRLHSVGRSARPATAAIAAALAGDEQPGNIRRCRPPEGNTAAIYVCSRPAPPTHPSSFASASSLLHSAAAAAALLHAAASQHRAQCLLPRRRCQEKSTADAKRKGEKRKERVKEMMY